MAKAKRRRRRKEAKSKDTERRLKEEPDDSLQPHEIEANPPQPNIPIVVVSGVLVVVWLIYLFIVAVWG